MHSSPGQAIKSFLKQIPLLVQTKRKVIASSYAFCRIVFKLIRSAIWEPLYSTEILKKLVFDTTQKQSLLISTAGQEIFVVSSRDSTIGRMVYAQGLQDAETVEQVVALLGPEHTKRLLVDIGANIGTVCVPAIRRGIFQSAIAIEPEPFNYSILKSNVYLNGLDQAITTFNLALGAKTGEELIFELSNSNYGDHRVRMSNKPGLHGEASRSTIVVKSEPFDAICMDLNKNDTLIWMDTQGYEGYILSGAKNALHAGIPLVIEFWPYGMDRLGSFQLLKDALLSGQYSWFQDIGSMAPAEPLTAQHLDALHKKIGLNGGFTDLLIT